MFHLKAPMTLEDLKDYTVVMPIMATINASQLALDVLIASKKMKRIGQITDVALMPVFGVSPFSHCPEEKASAAEIYAVPEEKLLAIQFRSALVLKYAGKFLKKMSQSFKEAHVRQIIVLSNSMGVNSDVPYCYAASESFKKTYAQELSRINWKEDDGGLFGLGSDKLFKVLNPENVPVLIFYHNIALPVDDIDEEFAVKELNELIVNFLRIGNHFKSQLPGYWKYLLDNETVDMMY